MSQALQRVKPNNSEARINGLIALQYRFLIIVFIYFLPSSLSPPKMEVRIAVAIKTKRRMSKKKKKTTHRKAVEKYQLPCSSHPTFSPSSKNQKKKKNR